MGVELGVAGPAGPMPERGADEAVGLDELATPGSSSGVTRLGRQVIEHGANSPVVGSGDRVPDMVWSECPEERDALRGRECQVVTRAASSGQPGPRGRHQARTCRRAGCGALSASTRPRSPSD